MGCDIHFVPQVRKDDGWLTIHDECKDRYMPGFEGVLGSLWDWTPGTRYAGERCYGTFARIADVRNAWGIVPLWPHRGTPDDFDPEDCTGWRCGDLHSHTWATFAELLAADWSGLEETGFVAWLRSEAVANLVELHGSENLRLLISFDN